MGSFLATAYAAGDNLLVVAKPKHWNLIAPVLRARGCDLVEDLKTERLTVLNAAATLRAFTRNDVPDKDRFDQVVGRLVRGLSAQGGLSIYGEMVELLAEEGDFNAALQLEELWNALAARCSFRLMCGYSSAHFASPAAEAKLHPVCAAHTHLETKQDDPLAGWLIERTRFPFKSDFLQARS